VQDYANVVVKGVASLGVISRVPAATSVHYDFCSPAVAHIATHSANLAFGPKSGFTSKINAGLGLQNEARLQLCNSLQNFCSQERTSIQNCGTLLS